MPYLSKLGWTRPYSHSHQTCLTRYAIDSMEPTQQSVHAMNALLIASSTDIDECRHKPDTSSSPNGTLCAPGSVCRNTVGSYRCDCATGYQLRLPLSLPSMLMSTDHDGNDGEENANDNSYGNHQTPQCVGKFLGNFRSDFRCWVAATSNVTMRTRSCKQNAVVVPPNLAFANSDIARVRENVAT